MGLFSKRRTKGFDPELWSDATDRSKQGGSEPWFADLVKSDDDATIDELNTNDSAQFSPSDDAWLTDDPGDEIRKRHR